MLKRLLIASTLALSACASGAGSGGGVGTGAPIKLGAFVRPSGNTSTEAMVTAFETSLGRKLDIDATYPGFGPWGPSYIARWKWDISGGRMPMISWSLRRGAGCASPTDILGGKYRQQIDQQAITLYGLNAPVAVRLMFEPREGCNLALTATQYKAVWAYIQEIFTEDATSANVKFIYAPNDADFADGDWQAFMPAHFDILGLDHYNVGAPAPFTASTFCSQTAWTLWVTESGAIGAAAQDAWFNGVKPNCPKLAAFVAFDSAGNPPYDYRITAPDAFAALAGVGK